jgi:2-polyprenyl-3-methyl-5-hydroxy-6-metoxy-1,4-benzoquinol methylase
VTTTLDVGCAAGLLGEELLRRGLTQVVHGIEMDPVAAEQAAARLDRVWTSNLDVDGLSAVGPERYGLVVIADVLEHLRSPWDLLRQVHEVLEADGQLVLSLPNIRYFRVLFPLVLRGEFEYADSGVLDRTHLRFFTRRSIQRLVMRCGFRVEVIRRSPSPWRRGWKRQAVRLLGDFGAEQFLIRLRRDSLPPAVTSGSE